MGDQMVLRHERGESVHDLRDRGGIAQHPVGDAGILLDEAADLSPGIHQALKTIHYLIILDQDGPDLDGPVTVIRREAGCFKVEHDYAVITHGFTFTLGLSGDSSDTFLLQRSICTTNPAHIPWACCIGRLKAVTL